MRGVIQTGMTDTVGEGDKRCAVWQMVSDEPGGWRGERDICSSKMVKNRKNKIILGYVAKMQTDD